MIPDHIALSRAIGQLPGAPTFRVVQASQSARAEGIRDQDGTLWVDPDDDSRWTLCLDDAATGGAMLHRLHTSLTLVTWIRDAGAPADPPRWLYLVERDESMEREEGLTLAVALAHVLIARGSWNA